MKCMLAQLYECDFRALKQSRIFSTDSGTIEDAKRVAIGDVVIFFCDKGSRALNNKINGFVGFCIIVGDQFKEIEILGRKRISFGKEALFFAANTLPMKKVAENLEFMNEAGSKRDYIPSRFFSISRSDASVIAQGLKGHLQTYLSNNHRKG